MKFQRGVKVYAATEKAEKYYTEVDMTLPTAIIMGSEGKGMRRLIEESCDISVKLQISPLTESLNVATAASIALYEINKE